MRVILPILMILMIQLPVGTVLAGDGGKAVPPADTGNGTPVDGDIDREGGDNASDGSHPGPFIDRDGDGIRDGMEYRFRSRVRRGGGRKGSGSSGIRRQRTGQEGGMHQGPGGGAGREETSGTAPGTAP